MLVSVYVVTVEVCGVLLVVVDFTTVGVCG